MTALASLWLACMLMEAAAAQPGQLERRSGHVRSVTARRAYLDAGLLHGLAPRQRVELVRSGRRAAVCTIVDLSDHYAVCEGGRARRGDAFALPGSANAGGTARAPPPGEAELAVRRAVLAALPFPLLSSGAARPPRTRTRAAASLRALAFRSAAVSAGGDDVRGTIRDAPVAPGVAGAIDFRAVRWRGAPERLGRAPDLAPLLVSRLELTVNPGPGPTSLTVGRAGREGSEPLLDGARIAHRTPAGRLSAWAGLLPDPIGLVPRIDRLVSGAALRLDPGPGAAVAVGQEHRLEVRSWPGGGRATASSRMGVWFGRGTLSAAVELGAPIEPRPAIGIDGARLDASLSTPLVQVALGGSHRGPISDPDAAATGAAAAARRRASADVIVGPESALSLRLAAMLVESRAGAPRRLVYGPELTLGRTSAQAPTLSLGWSEELGPGRGRTLMLRARAFSRRVRAAGSVAWTTRSPDGDARLTQTDASAGAELELALGRGVTWGATLSARVGPLERPAPFRSASYAGALTLGWRGDVPPRRAAPVLR